MTDATVPMTNQDKLVWFHVAGGADRMKTRPSIWPAEEVATTKRGFGQTGRGGGYSDA